MESDAQHRSQVEIGRGGVQEEVSDSYHTNLSDNHVIQRPPWCAGATTKPKLKRFGHNP